MINSVALFGSDNGRISKDDCSRIVEILLMRDIKVFVQEKLRGKVHDSFRERITTYCNIFHSKINPDQVLSIGGDGTFQQTILQIRNTGIPIAGVNAGRLGFLANIHDDFEISLERLLKQDYTIIERNLIELVEPHMIMGRSNVALNDITVQ